MAGTNCMIAFDANVLIYSFDDTEPLKHTAALDCLAAHTEESNHLRLIWQVACETLAWLRKRQSEGVYTAEEVQRTFRNILATYPLVLPTPEVLTTSFELRNRHSLSHWDSLLLAACISAGIDTLYSEDMSDGMLYEFVSVINPLPSSTDIEQATSTRRIGRRMRLRRQHED
jgi:predicted nucleic acid-binding protein